MIIGATPRLKVAIAATFALAASLLVSACDNQAAKPEASVTPPPAANAAPAAAVAATPSDGLAIAVTPAEMIQEQGHAWVVQTKINPAERKLRVYEDGKELGPGESLHEDVRKTGLGAYSHWDASEWGYRVYFSTSDNSDPTKNGRAYELR